MIQEARTELKVKTADQPCGPRWTDSDSDRKEGDFIQCRLREMCLPCQREYVFTTNIELLQTI